MGYEYGYDYGNYIGAEAFSDIPDVDIGVFGNAAAGAGGFLAVFLLLLYMIVFGYAILCYVLQALGMYTIAKRRGIRNSWLSWLPLGDVWILGSISDQYNDTVKGKKSNRRKVLLGLEIAVVGVAILIGILLAIGMISAIGMGAGDFGAGAATGAIFGIMLLAYLAMLVLGVICAVFQYIALYDLYASCVPDNAVLYLLLSILFAIAPFFVFFNRNKDLGMTPKKQAPEQPVLETAEQEAQPRTDM